MAKQWLVFGLILLAGCSGAPSESQVQRLISEQLEKEIGEGALRVENFEKTNGYQKSDSVYVVATEYDLVFLKSSAEISDHAKQRAEEQAGDAPFGRLGAGLNAMAIQMALGDRQAGARLHREQEIELIRTEKGWRLGKP